jgi:hypothetical protein
VLLWWSRNDLIDALCKAGDGIAHGGKRLCYINWLRHVKRFFDF